MPEEEGLHSYTLTYWLVMEYVGGTKQNPNKRRNEGSSKLGHSRWSCWQGVEDRGHQ